MSNTTPARPVPVITTLFVLVLFAVFFLAVRFYYKPAGTAAFVATPENFSKDQEWRASRESRQKALADAHQAEAERLNGYSWADQKAGVVRLPIERAMELTAQQYGKKKQ